MEKEEVFLKMVLENWMLFVYIYIFYILYKNFYLGI